MNNKQYTLGVDFGSLSCRAVLADAENGRELASEAMDYPHAVMDTVLAASGESLPPNFALQDPADYLLVLEHVIPTVIARAGVSPAEVKGICVDFTCCTILPIREDRTPLCFEAAFRKNPHAYVKMWKHHAAQPYADRITDVARRRGEAWLDATGGTESSEYMFPKIYQILEEAPEIYREAYTFIEAGDWINLMLTGKGSRGYQYAAYKCHYLKDVGYPCEAFFAEVDERLRHVVRDKLPYPIVGAGMPVGTVTAAAAARFGLAEGTAVASAVPDGHVAAVALDASRPGDIVAVLGTSGCFFVVDDKESAVPGICGRIRDGVVPGLMGYEAGLCCFGDHFAFAAEKLISRAYLEEADRRGISPLSLLIERAARKRPGESGVLALNWFNGNRSILVDSELSGLFVGITLPTAPEDLMRALIEATAFGTRNIFDNFRAHGVPVKRLVASGGIARKDPFTMQLFADVLGLEIRIARTAQAPALGSAIHAAVAAGIYPSFAEAGAAMSGVGDKVFRPDPEAGRIYDLLYTEYQRLHDYFGKENPVMKNLRRIAAQGKEA